MNRSLVLSILSDDKPGVVEALAKTVAAHQGNWLESSMSHLAGKFAGILQVNLPEDQVQPLNQALQALNESHGIAVVVSEARESAQQIETVSLRFGLMGNDRPGIIREMSQAFASHKINLEELQTGCSSMPWSGDPMFTAQGLLQIPADVDLDSLRDQLDEIADQLGVDIELNPAEETEQ